MEQKKKPCAGCGEMEFIWKNFEGKKYCRRCAYKISTTKDNKPRKQISNRKKPTGELRLFQKIYAEVNGVCEITGVFLPFNVNNFAHILSKGAYPSMRLSRANVMHVDPRIHHLYDCGSKEDLLKEFPDAAIIYERKRDLKHNYYNGF